MENKWIVAVSGGPDSMALLDKSRVEGFDCVIAHVNYHMRETSDEDMYIVKSYAESYDIPFEVKHFDKTIINGNFQKVARDFRYTFFMELMDKYDACGVLVAHHLDDDLETYIFQKERNMKSDSVGLNEYSYYGGVLLKRPLLRIRKQELVAYCVDRGIAFAIDESNADTKYTRNKIRKELGDLNKEQWSLLLKSMYEEKQKWNDYQQLIETMVKSWGDSITIDELNALDTPEDYLRKWMTEKGIDTFSFSSDFVQEMIQVFKKDNGYYEFGEWSIESSYGNIWLIKHVEVHDIHQGIDFGNFNGYSLSESGMKIEGVNLTELDFPIVVRNAKKDDSIVLRFGTKKVNRHFIDRKIPKGKRKNTLVIENSLKQVVFIVGLGSDVHHYSNNPNLFVIKL